MNPDALLRFQEANLAQGAGNLEGAVEGYRKALDLAPLFFEALLNLAQLERTRGNPALALEYAKKAVSIHSVNDTAQAALGMALFDLNCKEEALKALAYAHSLAPGIDAHAYNLGRSRALAGDHPGAEAAYLQTLRINPAHEEARYNLGITRLRLGRLQEGWSDFEHRDRITQLKGSRDRYPSPSWDGTPLEGPLLLHAEQGLGDTLMMLRYAPLAAERTKAVIAQVQAPLVAVAATTPGLVEVWDDAKALKGFAGHAPMLSLPLIFKTDATTIPGKVPYLDVPAIIPNKNAIQEKLDGLGQYQHVGHRVGLVWAGHPGHRYDHLRSIAPELLKPLEPLQGVQWLSLQKGDAAELPFPMADFGPLLTDFADTAYVLSQIDLLITVDTAVAHLAGALGIPTFLLLPFVPDWRWMLLGNQSPWYPSFKLYRQSQENHWAAVLEQVVLDLT